MQKIKARRYLLVSSALAVALSFPSQALAAEERAPIIVTAQKREQNVQDVPIAVTAIGGETLQANRVTNVIDLSGLAPGVTIRISAGASQLPVFSMRGVTSFGVVPGSDKQVSQYLDGVYIGSPRGSIFDLPDLERIEVLRGPQGTLFGRNATAGAVSIVTRDPTGEVGARVEGTYGNLDQMRVRASIDLPQFGPFSAYVSFLHDEYRGDIRNLASGVVWDRTTSADPYVNRKETSVKWLGNKNTEAVFAALKFESGDFTTTYKFDWAQGVNSAAGTALVAVNPNAGDAGPGLAFLINTLVNSQPNNVITAPDGKRPKGVYNSFVTPSRQEMMGHNVTSVWEATDNITVKNIFAFRKSKQFGPSSIDGVTALEINSGNSFLFGPAGPFLEGQQFSIIGSQSLSRSTQTSDELVVNYDSDFLTLTVGGLWYHSKDTSNTFGFQGTQSFKVLIDGVIPQGGQNHTFNTLTSLAAYVQAELHVTPQLDVILGGRITQDKKFGRYELGTPTGVPLVITTVTATYKDTTPSYLIGVNYKPNDDILVYAKFSTAFVSGGNIGGIEFAKEKAESLEGGIKAQFLNNKVQANLAVFWVKYTDAQSSASGSFRTDVDSRIGTFIQDCCDIKSVGFEFDFTAVPADGVTVGGSLSYADTKFSNVAPALLASNGGAYSLTLRPEWTGGIWGSYETQPLIGNAYLTFRADGIYQGKNDATANPSRSAVWAPNFPIAKAYWLVNGRVALRDIDVGGAKAEIGLWGKNLTNARNMTFALALFNQIASRNFIRSRSYGVDVILDF
ncbi:MAG: TonB-dependent receptor [Novosphingobium sp.]|nr:TonB-dependent receptor [Novosphingobium sp.]